MKPDDVRPTKAMYRLLDCQDEHRFEPVDPDGDRMGYWLDEYGEPHPRTRRWHPVRAWALALLESAMLWVVVIVSVVVMWAMFIGSWVELP